MKLAVITDSAANLSKETLKKYPDLYVIPLMIVIDGKNHRDQIDITAQEIYAEIDNKDITTSLPSMDDLSNLLEDLKKKGYTDCLVINLSSGLSGTFNAFRLAFEDVKGINITHYDSKTLGGGLGYIVEYAMELIQANTPLKDIVPKLETLRFNDSLAIYTINTLKYLKKGGRIGKVAGTVGDLLHLKPVITVNDEGVYVTLSKAVGLQRSLISMKDIMVKKFGQDLIDLTVHYGDDLEKAQFLADKLKKELNVRTLTLSALTPVLGIHTGPSMFAYVGRRVPLK
ncbi:MAG: DegV family protein [Acholeplasmataceae bacterium]